MGVNLTIKDIAEKSGYSIATVSRVINNTGSVSVKAQKEINEIINRYNFAPNEAARQLKKNSSDQIAIIVKGHANMLFAKLVEKIQIQFNEAGYLTGLYYIDEEDNEVAHALKLVREQKPLALCFLGGNLGYFKSDFSKITIPSVMVTTSAVSLGFENLSSVFSDDALGGRTAIEYLIDNGHKNIGIIGGHNNVSYTSQLRYIGCVQSFAENGMVFDVDKNYVGCRFSFDAAYRGVSELLAKSPDITAIFAMSDVTAIGAIRSLNDIGKKVPEDISVIGFDGLKIGEYYTPRLTTIAQDQDKIAETSVLMIIGQITGQMGALHEAVPFKLIIGESVKEI